MSPRELYLAADQLGFTIAATAEHLGVLCQATIEGAQREARKAREHTTSLVRALCGEGPAPELEQPQPAKPKRRKVKQARAKVFGYSATAVLRWMGANGWEDREEAALAICTATGNFKIADTTIAIQLNAGKNGKRGAPAPLTPYQARFLRQCAK